LNQSKSPPPRPISSSSSSTFGSSFFFGAYFFGYYFFFYWAAGFEAAPEADPDPPILATPAAMSLLTSFPLKDSMSLLRSSSETLTLADPKTDLRSAAA
jgi:hypothetical protein